MRRYISAIVTAAGESTRMGRPKPLLQWQGVPLIQYQVDSLVAAGVDEVVVVLGHHYESIRQVVPDTSSKIVYNQYYRHGKTTSVIKGVGSLSSISTDLVLLAVDQPRPAKLIASVIDNHIRNNALITSPRYQGRGGHPLIFSASLRNELESITSEGQGIREVFDVHRGEVNELLVDDPLFRLDLNTPSVYTVAYSRYGADANLVNESTNCGGY